MLGKPKKLFILGALAILGLRLLLPNNINDLFLILAFSAADNPAGPVPIIAISYRSCNFYTSST